MNNKKNQIPIDTKLKDFKIHNVLRNKIQIKIILTLFIFQELSLSELCKKIGKSKITTYRHLKSLINRGLIHISREEKVQGSIKAKFYKLKNNRFSKVHLDKIRKLLEIADLEKRRKNLENYINLILSSVMLIQEPLNLYNKFINFLKNNINMEVSNFILELEKIPPPIEIMFFSEKQFKKVLELLNSLYIKIKNISLEDTDQGEKEEKPYLFATILIEMKKLLQA